MGKQRLELTWIGKNIKSRLEPRILIEDVDRSYGNSNTENMLIHGDNLLALKALEQEFAGKIKCIFIDPPYNTGSAFAHYDDGLEHSVWLSLMRDRLIILRNLLSTDGSIWISIDDDESHYLKVLCDEIFGRNNFISNVVWQKKYTVSNDAKWLSDNHDHILVYANDKEIWRPNRLERTEEMDKRYSNPDKHPKGPWKATPLYAKRKGSEKEQAFTFVFKNGYEWTTPPGTSPRFPADTLREMDDNDEIWFGTNGTAQPSRKTFLSELKTSGPPASTIWFHTDVGHNHEAREEVKMFNGTDSFDTPKPERLVKQILHLASMPGDIILDSFLGSGTTAAVAHKMNRKWIGIELGDHCYTHCKLRLDKVVAGEDRGGISGSVDWKGGGGYKFYELAPSLLNKDNYGNWIINQEYNADMLAAAMAKQEGFRYSPDPDIYWKQGQSTEQDFIFTTTEFLTQEHVEFIHSQMKEGESLLICCKAFNANDSHFSNITIKKIPKMLMGKCEFGKDDYSLNIINIPIDDNEENFPDSVSEPKPKYVAGQAELFDLEGDNE